MGREYARLVVLFHRVRGHWSEADGLVTRSRMLSEVPDSAARASSDSDGELDQMEADDEVAASSANGLIINW